MSKEERVIFKYKLKDFHTSRTDLEIPVGSKILCTANQGKNIYIWFEHDVNEERTETRSFYIYYTGELINSLVALPIEYVDTVFMVQNTYVAHIYELVDK